MQDDLRYCAHCGALLTLSEEHGHPVLVCSCTDCRRITYRNAKPCAGVLIEHEDHILLVQRAIEPYKGAWDIPGGFLNEWEHPAEAALREAREETGLDVELTELLGIFVDRYGSAPYNTLNIYYRGRLIGGSPMAADDAERVAWFVAGALPSNLAFSDHIGEVLTAWQAAFARNPYPRPDNTIAPFVSARVIRDALEPAVR